MKRVLVAGFVLLSHAGSVAAAGMWSGCYIGGNVGGAWAPTDWVYGNINLSHTPSGFVAGGQVGCDYHFASNWLVGLQGHLDWANLKGSSPLSSTVIESTTIKWLATATARFGFLVQPVLLVYVKGGAAWVRENHYEHLVNGPPQYDGTTDDFMRSGWTIGVGGEYKFAPKWSAFVEYDYMDFGRTNPMFHYVASPDPGDNSWNYWRIKQNVHRILFGVNYRFSLVR